MKLTWSAISTRMVIFSVILGGALFSGYRHCVPYRSLPHDTVRTCLLSDDVIPDTHETVVGLCDTSHPLVKALLNHSVMRRLKYVDQHGALSYFGPQPTPTFTRYDHSIGVFAVLQKGGRPFEEQVAGLLHDASHTAFSHVADWIYQNTRAHVYQDSIHETFLTETGIVALLERFGLTLRDVSFNMRPIPALKSPRPHLSADRIEYMLHTGVIFGLLSRKAARDIAATLLYDDTRQVWYSTDVEKAATLADLALFFCQTFWSSSDSCIANHTLAQLLVHALEKGIISSHMLHYGTDLQILTELHRSSEPRIVALIETLHARADRYILDATAKKPFLVDTPKFWGIDPLVCDSSGELTPLSMIDHAFRDRYRAVEERFKEPYRFVAV